MATFIAVNNRIQRLSKCIELPDTVFRNCDFLKSCLRSSKARHATGRVPIPAHNGCSVSFPLASIQVDHKMRSHQRRSASAIRGDLSCGRSGKLA